LSLHADIFLHSHHFADRAILDRAQRRRVDLLARELLARFEQVFRSKKTADVVRARRDQRVHLCSCNQWLIRPSSSNI